MAPENVESWDGDLKPFLEYVVQNRNMSDSQKLYAIEFGSEVFTGENAEFKVKDLGRVCFY